MNANQRAMVRRLLPVFVFSVILSMTFLFFSPSMKEYSVLLRIVLCFLQSVFFTMVLTFFFLALAFPYFNWKTKILKFTFLKLSEKEIFVEVRRKLFFNYSHLFVLAFMVFMCSLLCLGASANFVTDENVIGTVSRKDIARFVFLAFNFSWFILIFRKIDEKIDSLVWGFFEPDRKKPLE
ncbi:MAG: hypothetical protein ABIH66_11835 [bacterium]